jgi:predicted phage terminase large subunit-like protein
VKIKLPIKFEPLFKPKRYKIYYGGRGGAKTVSFSQALLAMGAQSPKSVLCLREFMNSIDDSVHSHLSAEINRLDLESFYQVQNNQIIGINQSVFRYAGLARNISSIKSKDHFDIAWIEEGQTITQKSLDILIPTLRKTNSELWISFNPDNEDDPVYELFILPHLDQINEKGFYEDDRLLVVKTNLSDNPFAPQTLLDESAALKESNYKKWLHIYGGECGGNYEDPIFQTDGFQSYEVLPEYEYQAIFCDTALKDGEQNDFTVFQCWAKWRGRIYLVDQFRGRVKATYLKERLIEFWNKCKALTNAAQPLRALYIEDKASGIQLIQDIQRTGGIPVIPIPRPPGKGKLLRANNFSPWIKSGLLYLPKKVSWLYTYKNEFDQFTDDDSHRHDDQIDPTLDAIEHMLIIDGQGMHKEEDKKTSRPIAPSRNSKLW